MCFLCVPVCFMRVSCVSPVCFMCVSYVSPGAGLFLSYPTPTKRFFLLKRKLVVEFHFKTLAIHKDSSSTENIAAKFQET